MPTLSANRQMPKRMWINQPSTLQPLHHLHGTNVLAIEEEQDWRIYFLDGNTISQQAPKLSLSEGWKDTLKSNSIDTEGK